MNNIIKIDLTDELIRPETNVGSFDCGVSGMNNYLHYWAKEKTAEHEEFTFLVKYRGEIIGFYTIKPGIRLENWEFGQFDTGSACEIVNFAVDKNYKERKDAIPLIGKKIFEEVILRRLRMIEEAGMPIEYIILYALPRFRLIWYYIEVLGFRRLPLIEEGKVQRRIRPRYDNQCIFLYKKIH